MVASARLNTNARRVPTPSAQLTRLKFHAAGGNDDGKTQWMVPGTIDAVSLATDFHDGGHLGASTYEPFIVSSGLSAYTGNLSLELCATWDLVSTLPGRRVDVSYSTQHLIWNNC
jgi:hypothetical protein